MTEGDFVVFGVVDGRDVEVEDAVVGVEDFDVAGEGLVGGVEVDVFDAADFGGEWLTEGLCGVDSEEA